MMESYLDDRHFFDRAPYSSSRILSTARIVNGDIITVNN
jgi:hypothetical protein